MVTVTDTFETDQLAQRIFHDILPPKWIIRKQDPDFHIDYRVETVELGEPTGVGFAVQLKGSRKLKSSRTFIKYQLKVKHLQYYLDKVREPVFLVNIDVSHRTGYWVFLQEYLHQLSDQSWRQNTKLTIKIPKQNLLSDTSLLLREVKKAEQYMREMYPSSIQSSILHQQRQLSDLDPRFDVDISYHNGITGHHLKPQEEVEFSFQFRNKDYAALQAKMTDLIDRGLTVVFSPEEIHVTGSNLFQEIFQNPDVAEFKLNIANRVDAEILLSVEDEHESGQAKLPEIRGMLVSGKREIRFSGALRNTPFKIALTLQKDVELLQDFSLLLNFDLSTWEGQPVRQLAYFDQLYAFMQALLKHRYLKVVCEREGNHCFTGIRHITSDDSFVTELVALLSRIDKTRFIAENLDRSFVFPSKEIFRKMNPEDLDIIYTLLKNEQYSRPVGETIMTHSLAPTQEFFEQMIDNESHGNIMVAPIFREFTILGEVVDIGPLAYVLTGPRLLTDVSAIQIHQPNTNSSIEVEWTGKEFMVFRVVPNEASMSQ
ncbi:MAG: DUF4365 domain-containing protein [Candidatus Hodarchaeota archaeon]